MDSVAHTSVTSTEQTNPHRKIEWASDAFLGNLSQRIVVLVNRGYMEAIIAGAVRLAVGTFGGALKEVHVADLARLSHF